MTPGSVRGFPPPSGARFNLALPPSSQKLIDNLEGSERIETPGDKPVLARPKRPPLSPLPPLPPPRGQSQKSRAQDEDQATSRSANAFLTSREMYTMAAVVAARATTSPVVLEPPRASPPSTTALPTLPART